MFRWCLLVSVAFFLAPVAFAEEPAQPAAPSTITIHMNSMHPRDVLGEIRKQTDVGIAIWPEDLYTQQRGFGNQLPQSIDLDLDQASFWTAIDALCTEAKLSPQNGNNAGIMLQAFNGQGIFRKRPQSVGPLATILVDSLVRNHTLAMDSDNPQVQRQCGVNISAYVDPRARMLRFLNQPSIEQATDENALSLLPPPNGQANPQDAYCKWQIQNIFVPLDYDPTVSHKLVTLKGSIKATVAAEVARIEFTDLDNAQGTEKEEGGVKVVCQEIHPNDNSWEMKVNIVRTDMSKEQFRTLFGKIFQDGKFFTADGKPLQVNGGGGGGDDGLNYSLQCSYQGSNEKPVKMVWEIPTRTDEIDLPFEFHDLPLP